MIEAIPTNTWDKAYHDSRTPNAYVFKDRNGQIIILPSEGGALVCNTEHVEGDCAPYCD